MRTSRFICLAISLILATTGCHKKPAPTTNPLHWAAQTGNVQRIKSLLAAGADANAKDQDGWTPLHWAAHKGQKEAAELLIANDAHINAVGKGGWTPLFLALPGGDVNLVTMLLIEGADVNIKCGDEQETPLHYTIRAGQNAMVALLLTYGADPNMSGGWSDATPVHIAARRRDVDAMKMLIANNANLNARNKYGETPLHEAGLNRHNAIHGFRGFGGVRSRADEAASHADELSESATIAELLVSAGAPMDVGDERGRTPLHAAVADYGYGEIHTDFIQWLIAHGADTNAKD